MGFDMEDSTELEDSTEFSMDREDANEIRESMGAITAVASDPSDEEWQDIRDMLHALKGDVSVVIPEAIIGMVVVQIEKLMKYDRVPPDFASEWDRVEVAINRIISSN